MWGRNEQYLDNASLGWRGASLTTRGSPARPTRAASLRLRSSIEPATAPPTVDAGAPSSRPTARQLLPPCAGRARHHVGIRGPPDRSDVGFGVPRQRRTLYCRSCRMLQTLSARVATAARARISLPRDASRSGSGGGECARGEMRRRSASVRRLRAVLEPDLSGKEAPPFLILRSCSLQLVLPFAERICGI